MDPSDYQAPVPELEATRYSGQDSDEWTDEQESQSTGDETEDEESDSGELWIKFKDASGNFQDVNLSALVQGLGDESLVPSITELSGISTALNLEAARLFQIYEENDIQALSKAIKSLDSAAEYSEDPSYNRTLQSLGMLLAERYSVSKDLGDFERCISIINEAISIGGPEELLANCFLNLSRLHGYHFTHTFDVNELDLAIQISRQAIDTMPGNFERRTVFLRHEASLYSQRFHALLQTQDIDNAIQIGSEALELASDDEDDHAISCMNLSNAFGDRFESSDPYGNSDSETVDDLAAALRLAQKAIDLTPGNDYHSLASRSHNYSTLAINMFHELDHLVDLEEVIELEKQAINFAESVGDETALVRYLTIYISLLETKFRITSDVECLNEGVKLSEHVASLAAGQNDADRSHYLSCVADIYGYRFRKYENIEDLKKAILNKETALDSTPFTEWSSRRIELHLDLSDYLHLMYIRSGSSDSLKRALELTEPMLEEGFEKNLKWPHQLRLLSQRFQDRYELTGSLGDIQASIAIASRAVAITSLDHSQYPSLLSQVSSALQLSHEVKGNLADLEASIKNSTEALHAIPEKNSERRDFLHQLSSQLLQRYDLVGAFADLQDSTRLLEERKSDPRLDESEYLAVLHGLSLRCLYLHDRSRDEIVLDQALKYSKEALSLCRHPIPKANTLSNLGHLYEASFEATKSQESLHNAVINHRAALEIIPEDYHGRKSFLAWLGRALAKLFKTTGDIHNLSEAYHYCTEAVKRTPTAHSDRADTLNDTADVIQIINENGLQSKLLSYGGESPLQLFTEALNHPNAALLDRVKAGQKAFQCHVALKDWANAVQTGEDVLKLFTHVVPRWLNRNDQQHLLKNFARFTSRIASAFLSNGNSAASAFKALESGRGVIAALSIDLRADISKLEHEYPALYANYIQLRRKVWHDFNSNVSPLSLDSQRTTLSQTSSHRKSKYLIRDHDRGESLRKMELLESEIKTIDGFQGFLSPLSPQECMRLAEEGPIVAFNVTELRSDAILITSDKIQSINLGELDYHTMQINVDKVTGNDRLSSGPVSTRFKRNQELLQITSWLWDVAVQPVLLQLGLYQEQIPAEPLGRISWISSGDMGLLPLHAAGNEKQNALDYVVSSFTPTLNVLKFSRERHNMMSSLKELRMIVVPSPQKAGRLDLQTQKEVGLIKQELLGNISPTILDNPAPSSALAELPSYDIVHFSCHGRVNKFDPSNSGLELSFSKESDELSVLTIRDLAALDLKRAKLAYLSACSTAENSSAELSDETIHIASAFQLAGFSHVIGTLWEVSDRAAMVVSPQFYRVLSQQARHQSPFRDVASALHDALQQYRKQRHRDVLSWSSFIYMGA